MPSTELKDERKTNNWDINFAKDGEITVVTSGMTILYIDYMSQGYVGTVDCRLSLPLQSPGTSDCHDFVGLEQLPLGQESEGPEGIKTWMLDSPQTDWRAGHSATIILRETMFSDKGPYKLKQIVVTTLNSPIEKTWVDMESWLADCKTTFMMSQPCRSVRSHGEYGFNSFSSHKTIYHVKATITLVPSPQEAPTEEVVIPTDASTLLS